MRITRASSKLRMTSSSSSPSPHRVTNSPIKETRLLLRERPRRRWTPSGITTSLQVVITTSSSGSGSSVLSDNGTAATSIITEDDNFSMDDASSSVPEDCAVTASTPCDIHELPCSCGSPNRPTDPSLYFRRRCLPSNRVTERYIMSNLGITQRELDYIIGASLAIKDALATFLQTPHKVHQASPTSLFRISSGGSVVSVPQMILPILLEQCTVSDVNLELLETDTYSPSIADDSAWVLQELDLAAPFNLQLTHHRQFVCGFFVPLFIRLCALSSGVLEQEVGTKLVSGMPYFRYLAVKLGLGNVSLAKRSAWSTFLMSRKVAIMWSTRNIISVPGEGGQTDALMEKVETNLETVVERLQAVQIATDTKIAENKIASDKRMTRLEQGLFATDTGIARNKIATDTEIAGNKMAADHRMTKLQAHQIATDTEIAGNKIAADHRMTQLQADQIATDTEIARNKIALGIEMSEMKEAAENISIAMSSLQDTLETKLIANMNLNLAIHTDVITSKMDQFLSATLQQPVPATATVPIVPSDHCDLQVLLRLRNATPITDNLVSCAPGIHRKFTAGEPTDLVSRAVTRGFSSSTPFIVAVAGFSGGGKSFNMFSVGGLLETILCYLPDVEVTVTEVLTGVKYLCGFQHSMGASARDICNKISRIRTTRPTPANSVSSRAHAVVSFEDQKSGRLYGVLLDVAGDEESSDRALMNDEKVVSDNIALNNSDWRMMISELATPGKGLGGFVRGGASNFKRASKLNTEVSNFLVRMVGQKGVGLQGAEMPVIRVLYCVDGSCDAVVTKSLNLIKELGEQAK